jgi:glucose dehydrogenase
MFLLTVFSFLISANVCLCKVKAPPDLKPIDYKGIRYIASYVTLPYGPAVSGGYVEAVDIETKRQLWKTRVYKTIKMNKQLETDVQETFMRSFNYAKGFLILEAGGNNYKIDLKTGRVH